MGVKQSTSDLLIANCDEFIFYDDLAREGQRAAESRRDSRDSRGAGGGQRRTPEEERRRKEEQEARKTQAVELVVETFDALMAERGDGDRIWASVLKDALKRRKPDFNESYYGFRAFGNLLEERSRAASWTWAARKSRAPMCTATAPWPSGAAPGRARRAALQPADEAVAAAAQEASAEPAQGAARGVRAAARRRARGAGRAAIARGGRRDAERAQDDVAADGDREPAQDAARAATPVLPWEDAESWEGSRRKRGESRASAGFASTRPSQAAPDLRSDAAACASGRQPGNAGWFGRCRPARRRPGDRETGRQARRQDPARRRGARPPRRRATPWPPTTVRLATRPALPRRRLPLPPTRRRRTRPSPRARPPRVRVVRARRPRPRTPESVAVPGAGSATRRPARSVPASRHARA